MKKFGYFEKLSLAARWFLPREEAKGVIEDYRDILMEVEGPEQAVKRFGPPVKLVRGLEDGRKVRRWHFFFAAILFFILLPFPLYLLFSSLWSSVWVRYIDLSDVVFFSVLFFAGLWMIQIGSYKKPVTITLTVGLAVFMILFLVPFCCSHNSFISPTEMICYLSKGSAQVHDWLYDSSIGHSFLIASLAALLYFGFGGEKNRQRMSRLLGISLALVFLGVLGVYLFSWYSFRKDVGLMLHIGWVMGACVCGGVLCLVGALFSLMMARLHDRRWRSVMILCLTGLALCMEIFLLCREWSPTLWDLTVQYQNREFYYYGVYALSQKLKWYTICGTVLAAVGLV